MGINKVKIAYEMGYRVTDCGEVYYKDKKRKLNKCPNNKKPQYYKFSIRIEGKSTTIKVHRLQAYQKFGDKIFESGIVVRHLDGNSLNNHLNNIDIGTQSDNIRDIPKEIRLKNAINASPYAKKHNHREIYEHYLTSKSYTKTMKEFNISSKGTISYIVNKYKKLSQ